jgi:gliding motility-associated-like protein
LNAQFNFTPTRLEWQPAQAVNCATCPNIWTRAQRSTLLELMATDSQSCQIRRAVMLRVDPNRQVYIPNVFSPNGDSFNDAFTIHGDANLQQIISVEIFNRWGIRLYHGESLALGTAIWDGQFQQQPLPPDVYVYWIQLRFRDGETVVYKGDVTLVR